ncbi:MULTISPECIES: glycoside hydrolase family 10 protein [Citrobacter]|uniref:Glycoside hydrolase family 10 protein n=1 Tax=Citrobacter pasteurii TaxID=1563222 RepID=A0A6N6JYS8_9ENTR|nr:MULTISPECIES: glycoside hydrolase family 10 protein [Citrobacter]KAA1275602.1 glycoside hydrolase family 10 protein [Citrobacter pasteurii]MBA4712158.1 family 10 glycosylhydrolase [Citrobacter pasteurii]MBD0800372.1 glycoside hydrolase family 10 protein [Citrobacter sp. C6_1]MBD0808856.1 glycoside hydrolase family 10 protein [Citrobacter sp. C6_2]HEF0064162.1 glycoside hydrolase family 10 protein [Citrobacter pasteurii]
MSASGFISGNYKKKLADLLARSRARLPLTNMKWFALLVGSMLLLGSCSSQPPGSKVTPQPPVNKPQQSKEPVRGIWLATVSRLDWPPISSVNISSPAVRISQQQKALTDKLDNLKRLGINTVFFQVKPDATALWQSKILPWSDTLTGTIGQHPGYDPLQFMLDEAHKRGMKVHAWFNPYRVSVNTKPSTITELNNTLSQTPSSVYVLHRDWIRTSGERFVLDPGIPEVRDWITSIVAEVVENYPVDGVQFDDYFYTESPGSALNDSQTFRRYGQGFASKADWRRDNTQRLIVQVSQTIKKLKPEVEFGVSPAGVWRNRSHDPAGSDTRGAAAYDESYADTRRWVQLGLLDYIAPQLYWPFARDAARYDVLAKWWADVVKSTNTRLYIGVALYKVGEPSRKEPDWTVKGGVPELKKQLDLNESEPHINGTILFREDYLNQPQTQEAVTYIRNRWGR